MNKEELTQKIIDFLDDYVAEKEEIDDMAFLAVSTADLSLRIAEDEDELTEAWMLFPLMDLMHAGIDGYFTPDEEAISETAESILQ